MYNNLINDALKCPQVPSDALRCPQVPSDALRCPKMPSGPLTLYEEHEALGLMRYKSIIYSTGLLIL